MNPLKTVDHVARAVTLPFTALFVVGLTGFINWMTYSGQWWFKWVAFGMTIAVLIAWARAARSLLGLALVALVGWWLYKRYGQDARARFDDWAGRTHPQAAQVVELFRRQARRADVPAGAQR